MFPKICIHQKFFHCRLGYAKKWIIFYDHQSLKFNKMPAFEWLLWLALIQGITEFLPISSSAHLILPAQLRDLNDQGLAFDVAVHCGTLIAVVWVMRSDVGALWREAWSCCRLCRPQKPGLLAPLLLATIPTLIVAMLIQDWVSGVLRSTTVIAWSSILFGLLLWYSDRFSISTQEKIKPTPALSPVSWRHAWWIGLAQVCALIPGASRSGVTMSAALFLGWPRRNAAHFSFLLSIPVILAAVLHQSWKIFRNGDLFTHWWVYFCAMGISALCAICTMRLFLYWVARIGYTPFACYRIVLGVVLLLLGS